MTNPATSFRNTSKQDDQLLRIAGALAMLGLGVVASTVTPVATPLLLAKSAYLAGRMMDGR